MERQNNGTDTKEKKRVFSRSVVYRELNCLYGYPDSRWLEHLNTSYSNLAQALRILGHPIPDELILSSACGFDAADSSAAKKIEAEYVSLFEFDVACSPYESSYIDNESSPTARKSVQAFYEEVGLVCSPLHRDLPDHIGLEFEFMHYASYKQGLELEGGGEDEVQWAEVQDRFLRTHLKKWIKQFCSCLKESSSLVFYQNLAEITERFVLNDASNILNCSMSQDSFLL